MKGSTGRSTFRFDKAYHRMDVEVFVTEFFNDPNTQRAFKVCIDFGAFGLNVQL
jgi:hypothetical protein